MSNEKIMSVDEAAGIGYLQEINRRLLHPLGLHMQGNDHKTFRIVDNRKDKDGCYYDYTQLTPEEQLEKRIKFEAVEEQLNRRKETRKENLGFYIEPFFQIK